MPKLYHHAASWQVPGRQDRKATRVDVPSQPAELSAWLNARRVPLEGDAFDGLVPGNAAADELLGDLRETKLSSAGAVITAEELERMNRDRPTFLGPISADEIERRRMAAAQCPKCGNGRSYLHALERVEVESWIQDKATPAELVALAELIGEISK